jgi:hypothetical protein
VLSAHPSALLAPALLAAELGLLAVAARQGWLAPMLRAQAACICDLPCTPARRRAGAAHAPRQRGGARMAIDLLAPLRVGHGGLRRVRVVDLVSGDGYGTFMLSWVASEDTGIDISQVAVEAARESYAGPRNTSVQISPTPAACRRLTSGWCFEVLEHLARAGGARRRGRANPQALAVGPEPAARRLSHQSPPRPPDVND